MTQFYRPWRIAYVAGLAIALLAVLLGLAVQPSQADNVNDIPPNPNSIIVDKSPVPADPDAIFCFRLNGGSSVCQGYPEGYPYAFNNVNPGANVLVEVDEPGWILDDVTCESYTGLSTFDYSTTSGVTIDFSENDQVTCTFTNLRQNSITVIHKADPADDTLFNFGLSTPITPTLKEFTLKDPTEPVTTITGLAAGRYGVGEAVDPGDEWLLTNLNCESATGGSSFPGGFQPPAVVIDLAAGDHVTCTFTNQAIANVTIVKDATPADGTDFAFELGGDTTDSFTLDDADPDDSDVITDSKTFTLTAGFDLNHVFTETIPSGWKLDFVNCVETTGEISTGSNFADGTLFINSLTPGADVTCTFTNVKTSTGYCPADNPAVANLRTNVLGIGQGSPAGGVQTRQLSIPNYQNVADLYGQLAGMELGSGFMKYVRFRYPNNTYVQIAAPTSPANRQNAVKWWGDWLTPSRYIKGQFFWGTGGSKIPRAFVLWPTYRTTEPYADVFSYYNDSATNHVYWNVAMGWTPELTKTVTIPETQEDGADIVVKLAIVDNEKDTRPVIVTVSAGGVSKEIKALGPNKGNALNLHEILLQDVPAGTTEVVIRLLSPAPFDPTYKTGKLGGDSAALIGSAVSYACTIP